MLSNTTLYSFWITKVYKVNGVDFIFLHGLNALNIGQAVEESLKTNRFSVKKHSSTHWQVKDPLHPTWTIHAWETWERPAIPSGWACSIHDMRHFKSPPSPPKKAIPKQINFGF